MPGHSRPKDGIATLAYVPGIHAFLSSAKQGVDGRDKPGHDCVNEDRAAEAGLSVSDLLAAMVEPARASPADIAELDRQWAAIKAGAPTVPHDEVVRWLDSWGTPGFTPWNSR